MPRRDANNGRRKCRVWLLMPQQLVVPLFSFLMQTLIFLCRQLERALWAVLRLSAWIAGVSSKRGCCLLNSTAGFYGEFIAEGDTNKKSHHRFISRAKLWMLVRASFNRNLSHRDFVVRAIHFTSFCYHFIKLLIVFDQNAHPIAYSLIFSFLSPAFLFL